MWPARRGKTEQQSGMRPWRKANGDRYCRRKRRMAIWELASELNLEIFQEYISQDRNSFLLCRRATHEYCSKL